MTVSQTTCILFEIFPTTQNNTVKYKECDKKILKQNKKKNKKKIPKVIKSSGFCM